MPNINWKDIRLRKPLALFAILFSSLIVIWYAMIVCQPIPESVVSIIQAQLGICVGGYMGTSAYESVRTHANSNDKKEQE